MPKRRREKPPDSPLHSRHLRPRPLRRGGRACVRSRTRSFIKTLSVQTELYVYLKKHPFSQIELVGLVSNICVLSNAVLAKTAQPETPVIVDAACTASNDPKLNEAALDVLAGMHVKVIGRK